MTKNSRTSAPDTGSVYDLARAIANAESARFHDPKRNVHITPDPDKEPETDWVVDHIHVGNYVMQVEAPAPSPPTPYHSPKIQRTLMEGPGNRSSIYGCTCDPTLGVPERGMASWYAAHAAIEGGTREVVRILTQYDQALDVQDYPDHPRMAGIVAARPEPLLWQLIRGMDPPKSREHCGELSYRLMKDIEWCPACGALRVNEEDWILSRLAKDRAP